MINVIELISDPDFAQQFTVKRSTGTWVDGRFVSENYTLCLFGVIQPLTTRELEQVPEGDRVSGGIKIYTTSNDPIYTTRLLNTSTDAGALSDEIKWGNEWWKILSVKNFSDNGYFYSVATRKKGA